MTSSWDVKRIIVPHDFSEGADRALGMATAMAQKFGSKITLLHAYEVPTLGYSEAIVASLEFAAEVERVAGTALEGVMSRAKASGVDLEAQLRRGPAWSEIIAVAEQTKADLIVMGTHGRRGAARALLGSVAEKVVRTAPCPVLSVHMEPASP